MKLIDYERVLKIYPKLRLVNKKTVLKNYYKTAQIKFEGNYLVKAGFAPNDKINVRVSNGVILITKI